MKILFILNRSLGLLGKGNFRQMSSNVRKLPRRFFLSSNIHKYLPLFEMGISGTSYMIKSTTRMPQNGSFNLEV